MSTTTTTRLGHCTSTFGGHSLLCDRDGTYCALSSTHEGPCRPHGTRQWARVEQDAAHEATREHTRQVTLAQPLVESAYALANDPELDDEPGPGTYEDHLRYLGIDGPEPGGPLEADAPLLRRDCWTCGAPVVRRGLDARWVHEHTQRGSWHPAE